MQGHSIREVPVWSCWEHSFTSLKTYKNPYKEINLAVLYKGPDGECIKSFGFWDGSNTYKIRFAFPAAGEWTWSTRCSDISNNELDKQSGAVQVVSYIGTNKLYNNGFIKVSSNRRYLTYSNEVPFLWMADTAWIAPLKASFDDWKEYVEDRVSKHFSVIQLSPASEWGGEYDVDGNRAFTDDELSCWNPEYWRGFEMKVRYANERGLVIFLVGLMEPVSRYPGTEEAVAFARNMAARLMGDFVVYSPGFDSPWSELGNTVGNAISKATKVHLITQHPDTPWQMPQNQTAENYFDMSYMDFCANQTGHNCGDRKRCMKNAIEWNLSLYRHNPPKPVINAEAYYDANGTADVPGAAYQGTASDARALGYISWLSGSLGYTYGAFGIWNWKAEGEAAFSWRKAMQFPSAFQMKYMHDFFDSIEWWRLEPAHEFILNQPDEEEEKAVLAKSIEGDILVAYIPDNRCLELDSSVVKSGATYQWYHPKTGVYTGETVYNDHGPVCMFYPTVEGDCVLRIMNSEKE